jgi:hypothetical protein
MSRLIFPASPRGDASAASQAKYETGELAVIVRFRVDAIRALANGATGTLVQFAGRSNTRFQVTRFDATNAQFTVTDTNNGANSQTLILLSALPADGNDIIVYMRNGNGAGARVIAVADSAGTEIGTTLSATGGATTTGSGNGAIRLGSDGTTGWGVNIDCVAVLNAARTGASRFARPLATDADVIGLYYLAEGTGSTTADAESGTALTLTDTTWASGGAWDGAGGTTTTNLGLRVTAGAATVDLAPLPLRTGGGGGGSVGTTFFASDWSAATGNSATAQTDGGVWDNRYTPGNIEQCFTIVTAASAPAPFARTPNVLRLTQRGSTINGTVEKVNALPLNASYYGQLFVLNNGDTQTMNHPLTQNLIGGFQSVPLGWTGRAGNWTPFIRSLYTETGSAANNYPRNQWTIGTLGVSGAANLSNNVWYRYRWRVDIVGTGAVTTYRLYPEIRSYSNANPTDIGTLLFDANSYFLQDTTGEAGDTLQAFYNGGGLLGMPDPALARNVAFGQEGPQSATDTGAFFFAADLTLTSAGWPD